MSCYEWERGSYVIPSDQWADAKKFIRDAHNAGMKHDFALAKELVSVAKMATKGKRGINIRSYLRQLYYNTYSQRERKFQILYPETVLDRLVSRESGKLLEPKLKDFPDATTTTTFFSLTEGHISFDNKTRTVNWHVEENNHAVDEMRETKLGRAFFRLLDKIEWKGQSGGHIYGNDEYNSDPDNGGNGSHYFKDPRGKLGQRAFENHVGVAYPTSIRRLTAQMRY